MSLDHSKVPNEGLLPIVKDSVTLRDNWGTATVMRIFRPALDREGGQCG